MAESFFTELKRRNVFKLVTGYLLLGWLVLQVADVVVPVLQLPDWTMKLLLIMGALGLPFIVFFAWAFEVTPEGIKRDDALSDDERVTARRGRPLDIAVIVLLLLAMGYFLYQSQDTSETSQQTRIVEQKTDNKIEQSTDISSDYSIAVLPFLNLSSDKQQAYFSDGLADNILHMLAQDPELRVAARTSSFKFKDSNEDAVTIAQALGVSMVVEGSVQRQANRVRITVQLIRGNDGSHIWSKIFDETMDDIFRVQDEIAVGVASAIPRGKDSETTEANVNQIVMAKGATTNLEAYDAYLKGMSAYSKDTLESVDEAVEQLELAVELDPKYAIAWARLSHAYTKTATIGSETYQSIIDKMERAALTAVGLEPNIAITQIAYSTVQHWLGNRNEGRQAILRANEIEPNNPESLAFMSYLKSDNGEYYEAISLAKKALRANPLDTDLKLDLARHYFTIGQIDAAEKIYDQLYDQNSDDLSIKSSYIRFLMATNQKYKLVYLLKELNQKYPNSLRFTFDSMYTRLMYQDYKGAEVMLNKAEGISPERSYDDRAQWCFLTGDMECYELNAQKYFELFSRRLNESRGLFYQATLKYNLGDYNSAITLLELILNTSGGVEETMAIDFEPLFYLIAAYNQTEQYGKRDELLDRFEQKLNQEISNGKTEILTLVDQLVIAASRQDAELATKYLAKILENNYAFSSLDILSTPYFDWIVDNPKIKKQLDELYAREIKFRDQMFAEGIWKKY